MKKLKRFFFIFVTLFLSFLLQFVLLPKIPTLIIVPNLLLASVLCFGFLYGRVYGLVVGIVAGILSDVFGSGVFGFYILIFAVLGYLDGMLYEKMESELVLLLLLLIAGNEILYHFYEFVFAFLIHKTFSFKPYFSSVFLPETLLTSVIFLLMYGLLVFLNKKWSLDVNKGDVKVVS